MNEYSANIYLTPNDLNNIEDIIENITNEVQEKIFDNTQSPLRNIQVGDNLSGKTLYLSFPRDSYENITSSTRTEIITIDSNTRIAYIYDSACNYIDNYWKGKNICGFKNGQCFVQQKKDNGKYDGCCRCCKYNNHGCTTSNLACKLFNCSEVKDRYKVYKYEDIKILKLLNLRQRELVRSDYFSTREEVLKDLYSRSFLYSVTKKAIRQAKWTFLKK